jgi:hypothetical protein
MAQSTAHHYLRWASPQWIHESSVRDGAVIRQCAVGTSKSPRVALRAVKLNSALLRSFQGDFGGLGALGAGHHRQGDFVCVDGAFVGEPFAIAHSGDEVDLVPVNLTVADTGAIQDFLGIVHYG